MEEKFYALLEDKTVNDEKAIVSFNDYSIDIMDIQDGANGYGHIFFNPIEAIEYLKVIGALN